MEAFDNPLGIGVTHMVQQHRVNFLATGQVVELCVVPRCYLGHCCRPK